MHLSPPLSSSFGCCLFQGGVSVVIDSMFIVVPIVCGVLCLSFVLVCSTKYTFLFWNHLAEEERELVIYFNCLHDVL